ncbi:uncharacterized protein [Paramisgurnus dabryanus]|uniref:uncharacterized protein n=1 Tax=Paramisgurnus dabryanus TaxID=90735 RepID=UPI0031F3A80F
MKACCVLGCYSRIYDRHGNRISKEVRFFTFPTWKKHFGPQISDITKRRRMAWVAAVRRKSITFNNVSRNSVVCSRHFHKGKPAYEMIECDPDWAPSLHLGHTEVKATNCGRFERSLRRQRALAGKNRAPNVTPLDQAVYNEKTKKVMQQDVEKEQSRQDDIAQNPDNHSTQECDLCKCRQDEINHLLEENRQLKHELDKSKITEEFFKYDDVKVKYYTGLPSYAIFQVVLSNVTQFLPGKFKRKLTCFQMLLLTFMRLRLDLPIQHIAHLFNVDRSTVSTAFKQTVSVLYSRLSPLVHWPDRESLQVSMPHQFVEIFGNHFAAIVDCFEVSIERPSNLQARAQTSSNFIKDGLTLKYLISITPQGVISFISKGFGGRTSDKQITENCGFLDKLLPGDIVLADRGFDIKESVGLMCAEVKIPAFTKGQRQLEAKDVEDMTSIAHLRIHLERVIGVVRHKYKILSSTIPISMVLPCDRENVTFLDKIVTVCCALVNMCPSVVQ